MARRHAPEGGPPESVLEMFRRELADYDSWPKELRDLAKDYGLAEVENALDFVTNYEELRRELEAKRRDYQEELLSIDLSSVLKSSFTSALKRNK